MKLTISLASVILLLSAPLAQGANMRGARGGRHGINNLGGPPPALGRDGHGQRAYPAAVPVMDGVMDSVANEMEKALEKNVGKTCFDVQNDCIYEYNCPGVCVYDSGADAYCCSTGVQE
jgi:hypothetical protein